MTTPERTQVKGVRDGLGDKAKMIVADASYEVSDPTIDSQIVTLKNSGADIFISAYGQPAEPDASLGSIAKSSSGVGHLAQWLAFGPDVRHLKQEALEPKFPAVA